jgi:hypothetical protein
MRCTVYGTVNYIFEIIESIERAYLGPPPPGITRVQGGAR